MQRGDVFQSKSKVQTEFVTYIYEGQLENGRHFLRSTSGDPRDDCEVDSEWFANRQIKHKRLKPTLGTHDCSASDIPGYDEDAENWRATHPLGEFSSF